MSLIVRLQKQLEEFNARRLLVLSSDHASRIARSDLDEQIEETERQLRKARSDAGYSQPGSTMHDPAAYVSPIRRLGRNDGRGNRSNGQPDIADPDETIDGESAHSETRPPTESEGSM